MKGIYSEPFLDKFLSQYFVRCEKLSSLKIGAEGWLEKKLASKLFLNDVEKADEFDLKFFKNFHRRCSSLYFYISDAL